MTGKIEVGGESFSNGHLRHLRDTIVKLRVWIDGFETGRGKRDGSLMVIEPGIVQTQILLDKMITATDESYRARRKEREG